jgi:hypothetical protein
MVTVEDRAVRPGLQAVFPVKRQCRAELLRRHAVQLVQLRVVEGLIGMERAERRVHLDLVQRWVENSYPAAFSSECRRSLAAFPVRPRAAWGIEGGAAPSQMDFAV